MTSVAVLREQIEELEAIALEAKELESPAVRLMMRGLHQMRTDLERAVDLALRPELEIVIEGAPVNGHEIRVDALSRLLFSLQESIASVGQALTGKATEFSSLPGDIREATSLRLAAVFAGSFGATMRGPVDKQVEEMARIGQDELFPPEPVVTLLDKAVDVVLDLIDLAGSEDLDDDPIIDVVLPLGGRAFKHLKDLSDTIVDREMTANLAWKHLGRETRRATADRRAALRLNDVLTMNKLTERPITLQGHLGTASEFHGGRVEIQLADTGDVVPARVADELVSSLGDYYGHQVQADAVVTIARSTATGRERMSYVVNALAIIEEPPEPPPLSG